MAMGKSGQGTPKHSVSMFKMVALSSSSSFLLSSREAFAVVNAMPLNSSGNHARPGCPVPRSRRPMQRLRWRACPLRHPRWQARALPGAQQPMANPGELCHGLQQCQALLLAALDAHASNPVLVEACLALCAWLVATAGGVTAVGPPARPCSPLPLARPSDGPYAW
jgi:hypothetical protein